MNYYRVKLFIRASNGELSLHAAVDLWANDEEGARKQVYEDEWDPRLTAADCFPEYEVVPLDKRTGEPLNRRCTRSHTARRRA